MDRWDASPESEEKAFLALWLAVFSLIMCTLLTLLKYISKDEKRRDSLDITSIVAALVAFIFATIANLFIYEISAEFFAIEGIAIASGFLAAFLLALKQMRFLHILREYTCMRFDVNSAE